MFGFSANPVLGRRKERSPSPTPGNQPASFVMNLAFRPKPSTENHHVAKRLRADPEANASSSRPEVNDSTTPNTDNQTPASLPTQSNSIALAPARESFQGTGQRLRTRKRATVSPFIPRKPSIPKGAVLRPRQAPVFGETSMALSDRAEVKLSTDVERQHTHFTRSADVSDAHVKNESKTVRPRAVRSKQPVKHCVCKKAYDSEMVVCTKCDKYFHPVCVGKGLQDARMYDDQRLADRAYMRDAQEWGKKTNFCCHKCEPKAKPKPGRKAYSWEEMRTEEGRRGKLFRKRYDTAFRGSRPYICDHCSQQIIGTRYECMYCEGFDLCQACFSNPGVSSQHQHADGDMKLV